MLNKLSPWVLACAVVVVTSAVAAQSRSANPALNADLALQVELDRAGFSPGEIDGKRGANTEKALAAYLEVHSSAPVVGSALEPYVITAADAAGPFVKIPPDMMDKAALKSLGYASLLEALGEKFHSAPGLLQTLNPGVRFEAGATIMVPRVIVAASKPAASAEKVTADKVTVSKGQSNLRAMDPTGTVIFYAPVTSGSERDPLPIGEWAVTAVIRNPVFQYNPDLFWDADPAHSKAKVPAGPNGPAGVVWIDITKEHYGLHGSPEPNRIAHSQSHGCVRLTNWDATRLADLVKKGTPIFFVE